MLYRRYTIFLCKQLFSDMECNNKDFFVPEKSFIANDFFRSMRKKLYLSAKSDGQLMIIT